MSLLERLVVENDDDGDRLIERLESRIPNVSGRKVSMAMVMTMVSVWRGIV